MKKTKPVSSLQKKRAAQQRQKHGVSAWDKRRNQAVGGVARKQSNGQKNRCCTKLNLFFRKLGCGKFSRLPLTGAPAKVAHMLKFTNKELNKFQIAFDEIDLDHSLEVDYDEFLAMLEEPRSPYTDALFAVTDSTGSGALDIQGFFYLITTYSMYSENDIQQFVFQTFDKDASGQIDEEEFLDLARTVNNAEPLFPGNFQTALQQFDQNDDGMLDFNEFKGICDKFPMVFYPAFRLQDKFHASVLGRDFWRALHEFLEAERRENEYMMTHDGRKPPISCCENFQRKLACLFECCRGPRWRAHFDPTFAVDGGRIDEGVRLGFV